MRQTKNESHFETALRLTKSLKDNEDLLIGVRSVGGAVYLDSKLVLDAIYEGLTAEIPDPPRTIREALERAGVDPIEKVTDESAQRVFRLFPNYTSFVQSYAAEGIKPRPGILARADFYFGE